MSSEHRARADGVSDGFTDVLVEPYSPNYARARIRAWLMRAACRWGAAPEPNDEDRRLAATRSLGLWKTRPEERFDRVVRVAAVPSINLIALIALMERDREWFKSCYGLRFARSLVTLLFCGHAIFERQPLVVGDALDEQQWSTPMSRVSRACAFMLVIRLIPWQRLLAGRYALYSRRETASL